MFAFFNNAVKIIGDVCKHEHSRPGATLVLNIYYLLTNNWCIDNTQCRIFYSIWLTRALCKQEAHQKITTRVSQVFNLFLLLASVTEARKIYHFKH